ncbi:MAG: M48 family metallopeptidase [Alphaproteobacteria bacterium]|nr:M48 family metallopeptidase [Alphaproteobacteria bacterium]MBR2482704.1 M48 family metallopeptidase [Alphaproteobacteria bacterium]
MADDFVFVLASGEEIPVIIQTRRGLRNITLRPRVSPRREICMSKPWLVSNAAAIRFLESKSRWVNQIFEKSPAKVKLVPGDEIEFLGRRVVLVHDGALRSNKFSDDGEKLIIGGDVSMFERRVRDFIKSEFLRELKAVVRTAPAELWPKRIAIRDTTSRWGSCSSSGTMSFSWRLAFAPYDVMRYVVMHELAHVRHMNHSPEFWAYVRELYGFGVERAKRWLVQNGGQLHRYF